MTGYRRAKGSQVLKVTRSSRSLPPVLASLALLGPLAIHLFFPLIPVVKSAFALNDAQAQLTFTAGVFGMAFSTLAYGSLEPYVDGHICKAVRHHTSSFPADLLSFVRKIRIVWSAVLSNTQLHRFMLWEYEEMTTDAGTRKSNYTVKKVEAIVVGTDVQARVFTLAPSDVIPWHHHSACTDHYFVLRGALTVETRNPDGRHLLQISSRYHIRPGTIHRISNREAEDCEFVLIQGIGKPDWIGVES